MCVLIPISLHITLAISCACGARYKQYYKKRKNYLCHDENEECREGDLVRIKECRPLSKRKHFQVAEIVEKAEEYTNPETGKTFTKSVL